MQPIVRRPFRVPNDPDLRYIIGDGSSGFAYVGCSSEAPGQQSIRSTQSLPVGNGRELMCATLEWPAFSFRMLQGREGQFYCWKGAVVWPIMGPVGGAIWPLWIEVHYETVEFAPARNNSCNGVLG